MEPSPAPSVDPDAVVTVALSADQWHVVLVFMLVLLVAAGFHTFRTA